MSLTRPLGAILRRWRRRDARERAVEEFRRSLALIVDPDALRASVTNRLKEIFDPDRLVIFELQPQARGFRATISSGFDDPAQLEGVELPSDGRLARWFRVNETCLRPKVESEIAAYFDPVERQILESCGAELCAPMLAKNQLIGLFLLGTDEVAERLDKRDAELLENLANQASLAFHNAALYREQQERLDRLHRANRLAAMGQLAAGVAHEVRNPLTAIRSTIQYLGASLDDNKRELTEGLLEEVDRIDQIISGLLDLTHSGKLNRQSIDVVEVLKKTAKLIEIRARKQQVELDDQVGEAPILLDADPDQLRQVFLNLILNALQAMPNGGRLTLGCQLEADDSGWVRVTIADQGAGIQADRLETVFDPFYTTKSEGTGLGLSVCHNIVVRHGGSIELDSTLGSGTTASILLPQRAQNQA